MNEKLRIAILSVAAITVLTAVLLVGRLVLGGGGGGSSSVPNVSGMPRDSSGSQSSLPDSAARQEGAGESSTSSAFQSPPVASFDPRQQLLDGLEALAKNPNAVANEMVLTFRDKASRDQFVKNLGGYGLQLLGSIDALNSIRVGYKDMSKLRDFISDTNGAATAEANLWMRVPQELGVDVKNEGGVTPFQRGQQMMDAISAGGDRTQWGESVKVAVLDTGIMDHPTFGKDQITHVDLVNDGQTFNSHGTSVASLIAGQNPQAPGVSPAAEILDIRVASPDGYTVSTILSQGIIEAVDRGAKVLNISLGGYGDSEVLRAALDYAWQKGAIVVAAAGNEGYNQLAIPAAIDGVLSVGSVDASGKQASFSNSGQNLDIVAPGVGVVSAWETDKVAIASGTSHSTGLVSGAAAAYLAWGVPAKDVIAKLKRDATPTGSATTQVGSGILTVKPNVAK